jgi:hypothetical protein
MTSKCPGVGTNAHNATPPKAHEPIRCVSFFFSAAALIVVSSFSFFFYVASLIGVAPFSFFFFVVICSVGAIRWDAWYFL